MERYIHYKDALALLVGGIATLTMAIIYYFGKPISAESLGDDEERGDTTNALDEEPDDAAAQAAEPPPKSKEEWFLRHAPQWQFPAFMFAFAIFNFSGRSEFAADLTALRDLVSMTELAIGLLAILWMMSARSQNTGAVRAMAPLFAIVGAWATPLAVWWAIGVFRVIL